MKNDNDNNLLDMKANFGRHKIIAKPMNVSVAKYTDNGCSQVYSLLLSCY